MFPFGSKKEISLGQNRDKTGYEQIIDMGDGRINEHADQRAARGG